MTWPQRSSRSHETVAIIAADAEFAQSAADGARSQIKKHGFKLVYDQSYPPNATDFAPVVRAVQATNPDIVYIGAYPPDNVGIIRAANEIGLAPKIMGGAMIGMLVTPIKVQLGPIANGLITGENFAAAMAEQIAGATDFLTRYGERAVAASIDPLRLRLGPVRLFGRPGAGAGGDGDKEPRSGQARRVHAQGELQDRVRRLLVRQGRRMVDVAHGLDTGSERATQQPRSVSRRQRRSRSSGRPRPRPAP